MDRKNYKQYLGHGFYQHDKNTIGYGKPQDWSDSSSNYDDEYMIKRLQKGISTLLPTDSNLHSACPLRIKPRKKKKKKPIKHKNNLEINGNIELDSNIDKKSELSRLSSIIDDLEQDEKTLSQIYQKRINILKELGINSSMCKKNLSDISSSEEEVKIEKKVNNNNERKQTMNKKVKAWSIKEIPVSEVLKDEPVETDEDSALNDAILKKIGDHFWANKIKKDTDDDESDNY